MARKILLVARNPIFVSTFVRVIQGPENEVIPVSNTQSALTKFLEFPDIDCVVIDQSEKIEGLELIAQMRKSERTISICLLDNEAGFTKEMREKAARLGVNCILMKPVTVHDLLNNFVIAPTPDIEDLGDGS